MQYPQDLIPTGYEEISLLTGQVVSIPKAEPVFELWHGESLKETYGGKPVIDLNGEPVFAELAILRLLQTSGWQGVWIDTYRRKKRVAIGRFIELPTAQNDLLDRIYHHRVDSKKSGCFDVYCWRDGQVLFAESKRKKRDQIRPSQRQWLTAALNLGLPIESFLIVEWTLKQA